MRKLLLIILLITAFPLTIHAQDDAPPVITATVVYPTVNVRWMPETYRSAYSDSLDSRVGQVHQGDEVVVHLMERITPIPFFTPRDWVYATHPESGLTGWIRADLLRFEQANWASSLPALHYWDELTNFVVETAPNGLQGFVVLGGHRYVNVRAEPFISAPKVGEMPRDAGVTVLGRAVLGGITSEYIYVRGDATGLEGWVIENTIVTMGRNNEDEISALPVLYEVKVDGDLFQLPHVIVVNTHLRAGPGLDASIRRTVPYADYAVLGRNATGEWFHVMDRRSGEQGWIAVSVIAPGLLDINSLPVVE